MSKVRVGILGLGRWGMCHLEAFSAIGQAEVVAICDQSPERLAQAGDAYGVSQRFTSADELIAHEGIDLISVVTFESQHLAPTVKALAAGKHVLVEKPVTTKPDEAHAMLAAAAASGRWVFPGHLLRFDPRYAAIKEAIQGGQVGTPVSMYMKRAREHFLYATFGRVHTVYELMIHDIDLAIWYAGCRVKKVKAYGKSISGNPAPEVLWANLEFENGALAVLQSNWLTPDAAGVEIADSIEIIGLEGSAHFETGDSGLQLWNGRGRLTPDTNIHARLHGQTVGSLREQLMYICRCLAIGEEPAVVSFADAVHGVEVAAAIVASCESGQEVALGG